MKRKNPYLILTLITIALFIFSGCSAAKKPAPPNNMPNQTTPGPSTTNETTNNENTVSNQKAKRIAQEADAVNGVKKSTVVVSGNTAYIGLDLKANLEKNKRNTVENEVMSKVKEMDTSIKNVYVSSDVDVVTRLKKISQGISAGKPVSSFVRELNEIGRRLTPKKSS